MNNRRLLLVVGLVLLFVVVVFVWYFFYAKPVITPSLGSTKDPLVVGQASAPRSRFIIWKDNTATNRTTQVTDLLTLPLVQIWDKPATGAIFVTRDSLKEVATTTVIGTTTQTTIKTVKSTSTVLMFVDRVTGYIYGHSLTTGITFQISNTANPGIHDAYFIEDGKRVIMRYIDKDMNAISTITALVPSVLEGGTPLSLSSVVTLPPNITTIAVDEKRSRAAYGVKNESSIDVYTLTSKGSSFVASSPFREWVLSYGGTDLFVTSKPSAYVEGSIAKLPSFIIQGEPRTGLMSTPNNKGGFLNSIWSNRGLLTYISNNSSERVLPIATLASKCAWGDTSFLVCAVPRTLPQKTEGLPDDWLQGRVTFSDDIYIIDPITGSSEPVYRFKEEDGVFDITSLSFPSTHDFFSFTKKQDGTLWLLNTNNIGN